jgi:predicted amidophosphoribosyltransferase
LSQCGAHPLPTTRQADAVILDLLAPSLCWSCGAPTARAAPLCRDCRRELRFLAPAPVGLYGLEVWAPVAYEGPARDLVKALKFHGATRVASDMATLIVANAPAATLAGPPSAMPAGSPTAMPAGAPSPTPAGALVPVPIHPARHRARPFNQAALIAAAVSARTGVPLVDCLHRTGPDHRQVGRGRSARLRGVAGSIEAIGRSPPSSLLVDDVVTTGATLVACAAALREAGCECVRAIAFARTAGR